MTAVATVVAARIRVRMMSFSLSFNCTIRASVQLLFDLRQASVLSCLKSQKQALAPDEGSPTDMCCKSVVFISGADGSMSCSDQAISAIFRHSSAHRMQACAQS
jgi:hypothetical protein